MSRLLLFLCIAALINALPATAAPVVSVDGEFESVTLGTYTEYWIDETGGFSGAQVLNLPDSKWTMGSEEDLSFGFTEDVHWLRVSIENKTGALLDALLEIAYAPIDHVTFFVFEGDVLVEQHQAGDLHAFNNRQIFHRNHIIPVSLDDDTSRTILIRLQTQGSLVVPMTLRSSSNYNVHEQYFMSLQGAFFGIMLIMALYNLVLYTAIKDVSYLYYVVAVFSFGFFNASLQGIGFQFLWPEYPSINSHALPFFMVLAGMTTYAFSIKFLRLKADYKVLYWICVSWLMALSLIMVAMFTPWFDYNQITKAGSLVSSLGALFLLITAIYLFANGHNTVRFYLLAFVCLFLSMLLVGLEKFAVIPAHPLIDYSLQFGNALQVLLLSFALTDRISFDRRKRHQMEKVAIEADANNKAKSDFLATMSHEIRTPLNGVLGMTDLLRGTQLKSQQQHYLNVISSSGKALLYLINDILDYSKIEAGKMEVEQIDLDLDELILECASIFNAEAQRKGVLLLASRSPGTPSHIKSDANRIRQVLINLIGNAIKFTSSGSIKVTTKKRIEPDGKASIRFEVKDTGIGLTREQQDKLFTPYAQAGRSTSRQFGGTGLGLSISKKLSELLGGEIGVHSVHGEGSVFWFSVRYNEVDNSALLNETGVPAAIIGKRILIADESMEYLQAMSEGVKLWGLDTGIAADAESIFQSLMDAASSDKPYDLVLISSTLAKAVSDKLGDSGVNGSFVTSTPMIALSETAAIVADDNPTALRIIKTIQKPAAARALRGDIIEAFTGSAVSGTENDTLADEEMRAGHMGTILVAEDNTVNQMVIKGMLRRLNASFELVSDGAEAVAVFKEKQKEISLILMDCEMPVLDGFEATLAIRQLEKDFGVSAGVPIIAFSAHVTAEFREKALSAGMDDHLSKPVQYDVLKASLRQHMLQYGDTKSTG